MTDNKSLADIGHNAWFRCNPPEGMPDIPLSTRAPEYQEAWHAAAKAIRRAVIDECIQSVKAQRETFSSAEYATGQPHSSFGERFACKSCIEALEGLKGDGS